MKPFDLLERVHADRALQAEITHCLEELANHLPRVSDERLPRMLSDILEFSWAEHVSFQRDALFPIMRQRSKDQTALPFLAQLELEHAEIADRHQDVQEQIGSILDGATSSPDVFGYVLRSAFELRKRHMQSEVHLQGWFPRILAPIDLALIASWQSSRTEPPFPLNVLFERR